MEDVVLARLFEGQSNGFYCDVGGGHAVADNVTFHAYLQGWRGIVVEPQAALARLYRAVRPRDVLVEALCGASIGSADLFEVERFHGLSTASATHAAAVEQAGVAGARRTVPVTTLAALLSAHAPAVVDVLKIDVEGFEPDVIAGNDWTRHRPKVVLVEAIEPLSMKDASGRFEPPLLHSGYRFSFFDNLNRWYVAEEHADELLPRMPDAPLPWDSVVHLGEFGPAHLDKAHPDHRAARLCPEHRLADLPYMTADERRSVGLPDADEGVLGRIVTMYDGGYV